MSILSQSANVVLSRKYVWPWGQGRCFHSQLSLPWHIYPPFSPFQKAIQSPLILKQPLPLCISHYRALKISQHYIIRVNDRGEALWFHLLSLSLFFFTSMSRPHTSSLNFSWGRACFSLLNKTYDSVDTKITGLSPLLLTLSSENVLWNLHYSLDIFSLYF